MIFGRISGEIVLFLGLGLAGSLVSARGALAQRSYGLGVGALVAGPHAVTAASPSRGGEKLQIALLSRPLS